MAVSCGIDFGTSNTAAVLWHPSGPLPVLLDAGSAIEDTAPTLMYHPPEGGAAYGSDAVAAWLSRDLAGRLVQAVKRYLPSASFTGTTIGKDVWTLEALIGGYLRWCKRSLDAAAGEPVRRVVMGRPAVFHEDPARDALAQGRLEQAARLAGFEEIVFQLEPIAAARAFERTLREDVLCLVGDLGGGTSDFTVIRLGPGRPALRDRAQDVMGSAGVYVGGTDVDARIIQRWVLPWFGFGCNYRPMQRAVPLPGWLHMAASRWHRLWGEASEPRALRFLEQAIRTSDDAEGLSRFREFLFWNHGFALFQAVERAKIALSDEDETALDFRSGSLCLQAPMRRSELEAAISDELGRLEGCMDGLLARLDLAHADVGVVFLTGGTSRIPAVQALFERRFPGRVLARDAFTSVGLGLGVEAGARFAA